ncbi:hypothetical protein PAN31117_01072 [Pandoraea anapnoica]|uniref:Uncharacterized protein n=2 Tax=Pandoraea anapnoica TaxID=2508301 RepID=A0A5E4ZRL5_9BURK|nr:hypothetical protein PAN31117_01072 [Pandoraea anapnoica]
MLSAALALSACASKPPNERETGSGGDFIRYSSRQISVDLTEKQREMLRSLRDHWFVAPTAGKVLDAVAATLKQQGFDPVSVDREMAVVEADRHSVLVPQWRQILRGVLKSKIGGLPAKPDHERMAAIIAVRAGNGDGGGGWLVRVRFDRTVWDSNGDARTETVLMRETYDDFFADVEKSLKGELKPKASLSTPAPTAASAATSTQ